MIQVNRKRGRVPHLQPTGRVVRLVFDTSVPLSGRSLKLHWCIDPTTGRPTMHWMCPGFVGARCLGGGR